MTSSQLLTNYHTHTNFCDGKDSAENFVKQAICKGFKSLGFSSHAPLPFSSDWTMPAEKLEEYLTVIAELKDKYKSQIEIYTGLEYDYLGGDIAVDYIHKFDSRLDYNILSVHFLGKYKDGTPWSVDGPLEEIQKGIEETFNGDARIAVETYFKYLGQGVLDLKPNIVGHLDLIKLHNKNNIFFDESSLWYQEAVRNCLYKIKEAGSILELNTGGILRGLVQDFYPSRNILKEAVALSIPIMVNSDAHSPKDIDGCYEQAFSLLKELGVKQYCILGKDAEFLFIDLV